MPTLELSMIAKNGAAGMARCLASVRGIVDRITVGDTGSTDDTVQLAREFGANIAPVRWEDDFAAARNAVLAKATCDWILFLDADEMLDSSTAAQISSLITDPTIAGYEVTAWNYVFDAGFRSSGEQARANPVLTPETGAYPSYFPSTNTRLFRRHPGIYFEHCVHETVADRIDALHLRRIPAAFLIHHFGYVEDAKARRSQKEDIYYQLALKKVTSTPHSYEANVGAGIAELDHAKQAAAALPYFKKAIALYPHRALGWLYVGVCLTRLALHAEALTYIHHAIGLDAANLLAASTLGDIYFQINDNANARAAYERAIQLGDASPLSLAKLGATEVRLGARDSGMDRLKKAIGQSPDSAELYDIYAAAAFLGGYHLIACEAAEHRLAMENASAFNFLLAATLHLHSDMRQKVEIMLRAGISRFPNDPELRNMCDSLSLRIF